MENYSRYVAKKFKNFDPVQLAEKTEKIVCRGNKRKYTNFSRSREYGGIITGYTCGCCLRCVFCWADWSRDFPERSAGRFYSPEEAFQRLRETASRLGVKKIRLSGAEPTLGREHLLELLKYIDDSEFSFILETNGILFGVDKSFVKEVSRFKKPHIRVSIKAGTPSEFTRKTGAIPESFEIPFQAIRNLLDYNVNFNVAAVTDPRIMTREERLKLIAKLKSIDPNLVSNLEEEILEPFHPALTRLNYAGFKTWYYTVPFGIIDSFRKIPNERIRQNIRNLIYTIFSKR